MRTYFFYETGCIPGIPGTFSMCRVDIDTNGVITVTPMTPYPDYHI